MTSIHVLADDDATAAPAEVDPAWLALSAALTDQLPALADREDLTVSCAPGQGRGAPGCFVPALAAIEVDGERLEVHPATCDPARPSDRERYPATWGVLVHEAAHARHTALAPGRKGRRDRSGVRRHAAGGDPHRDRPARTPSR